MASDFVDLYLISGFLGSGKTSFLKYLLESGEHSRTGIIVNEFGSTGVDGKLLTGYDLPILEINNGSIFCACLKGGFVKSLAAFLSQPIDRLFVEASGLADPSSMEKMLEETEPFIRTRYRTERRYRYRGSICIVDAVRFRKLSDTMVAMNSQIQKSNLVVLNKIDRVTREEADQVALRLEELNPDAEIVRTTYARVPEGVIARNLHGAEKTIAESSNTCENRIFSGVFDLDGEYPPDEMERFLKKICAGSLRIKGFFRDKDGNVYEVNGVGDEIEITEAAGEIPGAMDLVYISAHQEDETEAIREAWKAVFGTDCPFERD